MAAGGSCEPAQAQSLTSLSESSQAHAEAKECVAPSGASEAVEVWRQRTAALADMCAEPSTSEVEDEDEDQGWP